jgi:phosphosulfolactate phosphohydrolase-like enzyme
MKIEGADGGYLTTDAVKGVLLMYSKAKNSLTEAAAKSSSGRRLKDLQRQEEIEYYLRIDRLKFVPQYKDRKIINPV